MFKCQDCGDLINEEGYCIGCGLQNQENPLWIGQTVLNSNLSGSTTSHPKFTAHYGNTLHKTTMKPSSIQPNKSRWYWLYRIDSSQDSTDRILGILHQKARILLGTHFEITPDLCPRILDEYELYFPRYAIS